ncbi:DHA2 family efflux MFS transporter permease subunit [Amycolatopsis roodepoortensis]|uniref:DHA2 family efflux MFS transporter permease subunit n=1 Tax=Amycolatopsis roodepoortensis TaxID=700274 RepID=UPI00214B9B9B|nr:DHA2 family efflux MFS transporter permease subunit [Amycolatopsis roodepoortensis]UUV34878.1 DHA2 family efflux MFS transporter permease subunit [Amycolatopsis roodepoortensis]
MIGRSDEERVTPALWGMAAILTLGGFLSMFTSTVVTVALGTIAAGFRAPLDTAQWTASGYLLALAAMVPVSGWASRRFGTTRLWLVCVGLFAVFSALCATAGSIETLIAFRVLQGAAGGLLVPAGQILFATAVGPKRLGRMMAVLSIPIYLAPVLGTLAGSVLAERFGVPWLFLVNVPLALLCLLLGRKRLPRESPVDSRPLDRRGLVLTATGLPLLVYGLAEAAPIAAAAGALLLAVFVVTALRSPAPLLELRLFRDRRFSSAAAVIFGMGIALFGAMIVLPLYYLEVRQESLVATGFLTAPLALGTVLALPLAGRLTDRIGGARVIFAGLIVTVTGTVPLALLTGSDSYWWLSAVQVLRGCGIGLTTTPALATGLVSVPKERISHAMPLFAMLQRIGGSFGTSILTVLAAPGTVAAIAHAHWWIAGITAIVLIPAWLLVRAEASTKD